LNTLVAGADITENEYRSTSAILADIANDPKATISLGELCTRVGDRGFGLIILLFALPKSIPLPLPGISTLTGLPLVFFSAQLCFGRQSIWLPEWLAKREFSTATLRKVINYAHPWLVRIENILSPRLDSIATDKAERITGGLILLFALLLTLPIPLTNFILGISIALLAMAITERNGLLLIVGWLVSLKALYIFIYIIKSYMWLMWQIVHKIS
jgi:hypothetical protein